jgi:S1-C subfamily serine protease
MTLLTEIEAAVGDVAATCEQAVVGIGSRGRVASGFVAATGRVLTSAHHIGEEATISFSDGSSSTGRVGSVDRDLGLAVVEVDEDGMEPLRWADESPRLGAAVISLARPGGHGLRASMGFVVAAERRIRGLRRRPVNGAFEHSGALPRGSAGGPVLNVAGELVGVNVLRVEGGLILALGGSARERIGRLVSGERTEPLSLGVAVAPPHVARRLQRALGLPEQSGVLVRAVEEGAPAERAGLQRGDLIVAAKGAEIETVEVLHEAVATTRGPLALTVVRGSEERLVEVELSEEGE